MKWKSLFNSFDEFSNFERLKKGKPNLRFEMSFSLNCLKVADIVALLEEDLGYEICTWGIGKYIPIERAKLEITKIKASDFFHTGQYFYDKNNIERLIVAKAFPYINPGVMRVMWEGEFEKFNIESFRNLLTHECFYAAYLYWEIDQIYQNTNRVSVFEQKGLKYDSSKVFETEWGFKGFSLEGNPGRYRQVCNMFLMSCFRMWFGPNSYELISKEKLETFEGGTVNKLILDNVRFIELYDDPFMSYTNENRAIQKKFNEWIDIEGIYNYCVENYGAKISVSQYPPKLGRIE